MKALLSRLYAICPKATVWVFGVAAFALWINANPYIGIDHDARLYSVMAYHWLNPQALVRDPWFLFGSQDDYTVFSPMLATAFAWLGVNHGAMAATLLQGMLYSIAVVTLARQGLGRIRFGYAALLMVAFPILYSPKDMLFVTEGFVTARGFAVPASILGLVASFRRRTGWSVTFHGLALLLHPIMALTPATICLLYPLSWRRRIGLLLLALVAYIVLLLLAIQGHLPLVEGDWRRYLDRAPLIFINDWIDGEVPSLLLWVMLLFTAACWGTPRLRRMYTLVPVVTLMAVGFSWLGGLVPWSLAMQAQFWRGLWIMKLLGLCAVADLLGLIARGKVVVEVRRNRIIAAWVYGLSFSCPMWAAVGLGLLAWKKSRELMDSWLRQYPRIYWVMVLFPLVMSVPELMFALAERSKGIAFIGYWEEVLHSFWRTAAFGLLALILATLLSGLERVKSSVLVFSVLAFALVGWDSRPSTRRLQEASYSLQGTNSILGFMVPKGNTVYWPEQTERTWLELGTASYVGGIHATGLVFSKKRMELIEHRLSKVVVASTHPSKFPDWRDNDGIHAIALKTLSAGFFFHPDVPGSYETAGHPTREGIAWLCQDPELDFVVRDLDSARRSETGTNQPELIPCQGYRSEGMLKEKGQSK